MIALPPKAIPGGRLRAEEWNALVAAVEAMRPTLTVAPPAGVPPHPWRVTAQEEGESLRINIRCGCVNDQAATIPWRVREDARGEMPEASRAAHAEAREAAPASEWLKVWWDRPLHEAEPPFLLLPLDASKKNEAWTESLRPPVALRDAAPGKDAKYYVAGVVLAAMPYNIVSTVPMPRRFRVYAGRANPAALRQARAGEVLQLAQVWQAREGGALVALRVVQKVFWNLACMAVEPTLQRPGEVAVPPTGLPLVDVWTQQAAFAGNALAATVNNTLDMLEGQLTTTEFWTT